MSDQPDTVQHEGEYWLTKDAIFGVRLWKEHPEFLESRRGIMAYYGHGGGLSAEWLHDKAESQPVRVRLELRAVRVEEESDGE